MKRVLTIAGSDCSGGAGIQADLKTITAYGMYGMSAITALTVQNTKGVFDICEPDGVYLKGQLEAVFTDIAPDAVKVGMLSSPKTVKIVTEALKTYRPRHVVVDPVMVSTSGYSLMGDGAAAEAKNELYTLASVLTPNLAETRALMELSGCRMEIETKEEMEAAARTLSENFKTAVLVKGGHFSGGADDCLFADGKAVWFLGERLETKNTHGTGCTLSSAIACGLAAGWPMEKAVECAKWYLTEALRHEPGLGHGNGPVNHCFAIPEAFGMIL